MLAPDENADFKSKYAETYANRKGARTSNGELIIPCGHLRGETEGVNNKLVYAKGNGRDLQKLTITKIVEIHHYDETSVGLVRDFIKESEEKYGNSSACNDVEKVFGEGTLSQYTAQDFPSYWEHKRNSGARSSGVSSNGNRQDHRPESDGRGDSSGSKREVSDGSLNKKGKTQYSLKEIVTDDGVSHGIGVKLDSTLLDNLTPDERVWMVKEYVKEMGGEVLTAYDSSGNAVDITIAESKKQFTNKNGRRIPVNKNLVNKKIYRDIKQEAIVLIDELTITSKKDGEKEPKYPHGWLDNQGKNRWEYWKTYIEDKNNVVWEATLNVTNSQNGEKILYDISPIKKAGRSIKLDTIPANDSISQDGETVNTGIENNSSYSLKRDSEPPSTRTTNFLKVISDMMEGKPNAADRLAKYVDSGAISLKDYDMLVERYKAIPTGEKAYREVTVPSQTTKVNKVSRTVRTVLEAGATPDEAVPTIEKMVEDGEFSYEVYTDKAALAEARDHVTRFGWDDSLRDWLKKVETGTVLQGSLTRRFIGSRKPGSLNICRS